MKEEKEWKIPENLKEVSLPTFPINAMPEILKKYAEGVAEELQVPIDMVATGILATLALCNQGKYMVQGKEGWLEPVNLYTMNVARPSERKSPTLAKIIKCVNEYEKEENKKRVKKVKNNRDIKEMYENKLKNLKLGGKKKDIELTKKEIEQINEILANYEELNFLRLLVDDTTSEALTSVMQQNDEKIGMFSSEGGIIATMAGRYNNNIANIDIFLKGYSGDRLIVDRKGRETEVLDSPLLTILLFVQPIVMEELFANDEFRRKGLCARFLYCYPKSKVGNRNVNSKPIEEEIENNYANIIKKLLEKETKEAEILTLSPEAYVLSQNFAEWIENGLREELEEIDEWVGKFHGNVLRIAGNLHIAEMDNNNLIIPEKTIENAISIGLYYLEQSKYVHKIVGTDIENLKAKRIIETLIKKKVKGEINRHQLFRECRGKWIDKIDSIERPLQILEEEGYIRIKCQEAKEGVGRKPDYIIQLNPNIFK